MNEQTQKVIDAVRARREAQEQIAAWDGIPPEGKLPDSPFPPWVAVPLQQSRKPLLENFINDVIGIGKTLGREYRVDSLIGLELALKLIDAWQKLPE